MILNAVCSLMLTLQLIGLCHQFNRRGEWQLQGYVVVE